MISTRKDTHDLLEYFFEDDIMLERFMEYFNDFQLDVNLETYTRIKMKRMIKDGVSCRDIADKIGTTYGGVWRSKDRLLKRELSKHIGDKNETSR